MLPRDPGEISTGAKALADLALAMQAALRVIDVQSNYLETVAALVRADTYGFAHYEDVEDRLVPTRTLTRAAPDGLVLSYDALGAERDPVLMAARAANAPLDNSRVMSPAAWRDDSLCAVLSRHGLHHTMVVPLIGSDFHLFGTLYFARGSDERPFSATDLEAMGIAKRHVELALARAAAHEHLDQHAAALGWAFDQAEVPMILSIDSKQVMTENAAVRRLVRVHRAAKAPIAELVARNIDQLAAGHERTVTRIAALPAVPGVPTTGNLRLTIKSTALRRGPTAVVSFVFVQRKDVVAPLEYAPLSAREREIVAWVSEGLTNRKIADLAFVSENTVRQHLKRIFNKLNVHSRAELVQAIWQGGTDLTDLR